MTAVWADTGAQERRAQSLREIATRLLSENDPQKLRTLIAELTLIIKDQLRTIPSN